MLIRCQFDFNLIDIRFALTEMSLKQSLFEVIFLFSEKHIFRKQKRTVVYGRASLVSDFKLMQESNDLLSSRHK